MACSSLALDCPPGKLCDAPLDELLPLRLTPAGLVASPFPTRATTFSLFFIAPLIRSPLVGKPDASGRRQTAEDLASVARALLFFRGLFLFSIDIHKGNYRAIDLVIGGRDRVAPEASTAGILSVTIAASNPPAEPPMPTTGQEESLPSCDRDGIARRALGRFAGAVFFVSQPLPSAIIARRRSSYKTRLDTASTAQLLWNVKSASI